MNLRSICSEAQIRSICSVAQHDKTRLGYFKNAKINFFNLQNLIFSPIKTLRRHFPVKRIAHY
jgi:hypothetical protein